MILSPKKSVFISIVIFLLLCSIFYLNGVSPMSFSLFVAVIILGVIIPGKLIYRENFWIGMVFGIIFLTLAFYISNLLLMNWLVFAIIIIADIVWLVKNRGKIESIPTVKLEKPDIALIIILLTTVVIIFYGSLSTGFYDEGYVLYGPHGLDSIAHISLIAELKHNIGHEVPAFAGIKLSGYHIFSDVFAAAVSYIGNIELMDLYIKFLPLFIIPLTIAVAYVVSGMLFNNKKIAIFITFLIIFSGNFSFIVGIMQGNWLKPWDAVFYNVGSELLFFNMPYTFSIPILFAALYFMQKLMHEHQSFLNIILLGFLLGIAFEYKIYLWIVALGAMAIAGIFCALAKKEFRPLAVVAVSLIVASPFILQNLEFAEGGLFKFHAGWMVISSLMYSNIFPNLTEMLKTMLINSKIIEFLALVVTSFFIFFIGFMGLRIMGIKDFLKKLWNYKNQDFLTIFLINAVLISFTMMMFFLFQKDILETETIRFGLYFIIFFNILAAPWFIEFMQKYSKIVPILIIIIFLISPVQSLITKNIETKLIVPYDMYDSFIFLRKNTPEDSIIIFPVCNTIISSPNTQQNNFSAMENDCIVEQANTVFSGMSERRVVLDSLRMARQVGTKEEVIDNRIEDIKEFYSTNDPEKAMEIVKKYGIDYVYEDAANKIKFEKNWLKLEWQREDIRIYSIATANNAVIY